MVPEGWGRKPLSEVADVRTGIAKGKTGFKDPIEVPYLRVANVQDSHIDLSEVKTIQIEKDKLERYSLKAGDVLMTEGGDFDKLGRGDVWGGQVDPCLHQNHVFAVRVNPDILLPRFLASLSASHYGKNYFLSCAKKSTNLASLNSTQLKEFPVLVPPLSEQKKIAQILYIWNQSIAITEKLLTNSQQQKKALMQQLLTGKKRLNGMQPVNTGFPRDWNSMRLEELGKVINGLTYSPEDVTDGSGTLVLRSSNIQNGSLAFDDNVYVSCHVKEENITRENDILICVRNGSRNLIGKNALLTGSAVGCFHGAFMSLYRADEPIFVYQLMQSSFFTKEVRKNLGATINSINGSDLRKFKFVVPPTVEERNAIAAVLSTADKEIQTLQQKLTHLKQEKKSLMQQLLTGKRRVKPDPIEEPAC